MFQIEIPRRTRACIACEALFEPEASYFSSLRHEEEDYLRQDYCPACWEKNSQEGVVAFWKGEVSKKKEEIELPKDKEERAMALLRQSLSVEDEENKMLAFYLSLYLQRQKILILRKEMDDKSGQRVYLYEVRETEEILAVPRVNISKGALAVLQRKIAALLSSS